MSPATDTGTKPSRNETEERLLDAALTLFASKGFAATSVREIIEMTGVTRPVLYYYCDSKQDLFERVVRWKHDEAYQELEATIATSRGIANQLRAIIRGTFAFCVADPRVPQLMFQTTYGPVVSELTDFLRAVAEIRFGIVAKVMHEATDSGEMRGGEPRSLALLFCSIMDYHANTLSRLADPKHRLTRELADSLVDAFLYGVATGRRKIPAIPDVLRVS